MQAAARAATGRLGAVIDDYIVPERLERACRAAGIETRQALSEVAGIDAAQVTRWYSRQSAPSGPALARICKRLRVAPGWLFGDDEQPSDVDKIAAQLGELDHEGLDIAASYIGRLLRAQAQRGATGENVVDERDPALRIPRALSAPASAASPEPKPPVQPARSGDTRRRGT